VSPPKPTSKPSQIAEVLKDVFEKLSVERLALTREDVERCWKDLVGGGGLKHSKPAVLKRGVLTVFVDSSAWLQELSMKKRGLLKGLKRKFGKDKISEIQLKVGEV
jgi:predicted nucleic acid-binding Zn ribbon protein